MTWSHKRPTILVECNQKKMGIAAYQETMIMKIILATPRAMYTPRYMAM